VIARKTGHKLELHRKCAPHASVSTSRERPRLDTPQQLHASVLDATLLDMHACGSHTVVMCAWERR
jgi:hypothetical protein